MPTWPCCAKGAPRRPGRPERNTEREARMGSYVGAVWRCRYFWLSLVKMDLRTRYRRSVLGMGWSLLHPIAMTIVLCVVFQTAFAAGGGIRQYAPYLLAGLACWSYIVNVTVQGCQSLY